MAGGLGAGHLGAGVDLDAALLEGALELRRHRLVLAGHQPRQQLDDGHLAAVALEDRRELDADRAAAHDRDRLGHLRQVDRLVAEDDALLVDLDAGHRAGRRSGGDDQFLGGGDRLGAAGVQRDLDALAAGEPGGALDPVDLVLLEEHLDAAGQPGDHLVLAGVHRRHVDADTLPPSMPAEAPFLGRLRHLEGVGVLEQRLGRDAAPDEAGAAEGLLALDHRHLQAELRGANRRDVAAGPRAHHHDVVFARHARLLLSSDHAVAGRHRRQAAEAARADSLPLSLGSGYPVNRAAWVANPG